VIVATIGWLLLRLLRSPAGTLLCGRFFRRRGARLSTAVLSLYLLLGVLNLIQVPGQLRNASIIDLIFQSIPRERTYSAPLADRVLLAANESAENPVNRVRGIHLLGTDINGYDVIYNVCRGCGTVLLLLTGTMLISFPLGTILGLLAGYFGGRIDDMVQWLYNTISSIPWLLFVIAFLILFGRSLFWICLAFGLTSWVELARLIRGETLKLREYTFIRAARASGVPGSRILIAHLFPNLSHIFIISFTLTATSIVLAESILTFIGIGVQPGSASWGLMLVEAQIELVRTPPIWWVFVGASFLGIFPLVLALNIFGDRLRDALEPE
ncbi:MAG: ABC transporter permease, partial [Leptospiraceae bacterium]|nr:ABC transporter permease [Leptospiraceae bacterium]